MEEEKWVDITEALSASAQQLSSNELHRSCHYNSTAAMAATVIGCPKSDLGHPVSNRVTYQSLKQHMTFQKIILEQDNPNIQLACESAVRLMDGVISQISNYLTTRESFYDTLGSCVFLHNHAEVLNESSPILKVYMDGMLYFFELSSRLRRFTRILFSRTMCEFRYSCETVWHCQAQHSHVNNTVRRDNITKADEWNYYLQGIQQRYFSAKRNIQYLPFSIEPNGTLNFIKDTIQCLISWIHTHKYPVYTEVRHRLSLCCHLLQAVHCFHDLNSFSDQVLFFTLKHLISVAKEMKRIYCIRSSTKHSKIIPHQKMRNESCSNSTQVLYENAISSQIDAYSSPTVSSYFNPFLTQYMSTSFAVLCKPSLNFLESIKAFRELVIKVFYIILFARATSEAPTTFSSIYTEFLQRFQTHHSTKLTTEATICEWRNTANPLSAVAFLFRSLIFPLSLCISLSVNDILPLKERCIASLSFLSRVLCGAVVRSSGEEVIYPSYQISEVWETAELASLYHTARELTVIVVRQPWIYNGLKYATTIPVLRFSVLRWCIIYTRFFFRQNISSQCKILMRNNLRLLALLRFLFSLTTGTKQQPLSMNGFIELCERKYQVAFSNELRWIIYPTKNLSCPFMIWFKHDHSPTGTTVHQGVFHLRDFLLHSRYLSSFRLLTLYWTVQRVRRLLLSRMVISSQIFSISSYPLIFHTLEPLCLAEAFLDAKLVHSLGLDDSSIPLYRYHPCFYLAHLFNICKLFIWFGYVWGYFKPLTYEQRLAEPELWKENLDPLLNPLLLHLFKIFPKDILPHFDAADQENPYQFNNFFFEQFLHQREQFITTCQQWRDDTQALRDKKQHVRFSDHLSHIIFFLQKFTTNFYTVLCQPIPRNLTFFSLYAQEEVQFQQKKVLRWFQKALLYIVYAFLYVYLKCSSNFLKAGFVWHTPWNIPYVYVHNVKATLPVKSTEH